MAVQLKGSAGLTVSQRLVEMLNKRGVNAYAGSGDNSNRVFVAYSPTNADTPYNFASFEVGAFAHGDQDVVEVSGKLFNNEYTSSISNGEFLRYKGADAGYQYAADVISHVSLNTHSPHQFYDSLMQATRGNAQSWQLKDRQGNELLEEMVLNTRQVRRAGMNASNWASALRLEAQELGLIVNPDMVSLNDDEGHDYDVMNVTNLPGILPDDKWKRDKALYRERHEPAEMYPGMGQYGGSDGKGTTFARIAIADPGQVESAGGGMVVASEMYANVRGRLQPTRLESPTLIKGLTLADETEFGYSSNIVVGRTAGGNPINQPLGGSEEARITGQSVSIGVGREVVDALTDMLGKSWSDRIKSAVGSAAFEGNPSTQTADAARARAPALRQQWASRNLLAAELQNRLHVPITFSENNGIEIQTDVEKRVNASFKRPDVKGAGVYVRTGLTNATGDEVTALANKSVLKIPWVLRDNDISFYTDAPESVMNAREKVIAQGIQSFLINDQKLGADWRTKATTQQRVQAYQSQQNALTEYSTLHMLADTKNFMALEYGSGQNRFNALSLAYLSNAGGNNMRSLVDTMIRRGADPRIGSIAAALTNRGTTNMGKQFMISETSELEEIGKLLDKGVGRNKALVLGTEWGLHLTVQSFESVPKQGSINATWKRVMAARTQTELEAAYKEYKVELAGEYLAPGSVKQFTEIQGATIGGKARYANADDARFRGTDEQSTKQAQMRMFVGAKQIADIANTRSQLEGHHVSFSQVYQDIQGGYVFNADTRSPESMGVSLKRLAIDNEGMGDIAGKLEEIDRVGLVKFLKASKQKGEFWEMANPLVSTYEAINRIGDNDGDANPNMVVTALNDSERGVAEAALMEQQSPERRAYERLTGIVMSQQGGADRIRTLKARIASVTGIKPENVTMEQMIRGVPIGTTGERVRGIEAMLPGTGKSQNVISDVENEDEMDRKTEMNRVINAAIPVNTGDPSKVSASQQEFERGRGESDIYSLAHLLGLRMSRVDQQQFNAAAANTESGKAMNELGIDPYRTAAMSAINPYLIPTDFATLPPKLYNLFKSMESATGSAHDRSKLNSVHEFTDLLAHELITPSSIKAPITDANGNPTFDAQGNPLTEDRMGLLVPDVTLAQMFLPRKSDGTYDYSRFSQIVEEINQGNLQQDTRAGLEQSSLADFAQGFLAQNFMKADALGRYDDVTDPVALAEISARRRQVQQLQSDRPDIFEDLFNVRRNGVAPSTIYEAGGTAGKLLNQVMRVNLNRAAPNGDKVTGDPLVMPDQKKEGGILPPEMSNDPLRTVRNQRYLSASTIGQFFGNYSAKTAMLQIVNKVMGDKVRFNLEESDVAFGMVGEHLDAGNRMERIFSNTQTPDDLTHSLMTPDVARLTAEKADARFGYRFKSREELQGKNNVKIYPELAGIGTSVLPDYIKFNEENGQLKSLTMTDLKAKSSLGLSADQQRQYQLQQNIYMWGLVDAAQSNKKGNSQNLIDYFTQTGGMTKPDAVRATRLLRQKGIDAFTDPQLVIARLESDPMGIIKQGKDDLGLGSEIVPLNKFSRPELESEMNAANSIYQGLLEKPQTWREAQAFLASARAGVAEWQKAVDADPSKRSEPVIFEHNGMKSSFRVTPGDDPAMYVAMAEHQVAQQFNALQNGKGPQNSAQNGNTGGITNRAAGAGQDNNAGNSGNGNGGGGTIINNNYYGGDTGFSGNVKKDYGNMDVVSRILEQSLTEKGKLQSREVDASGKVIHEGYVPLNSPQFQSAEISGQSASLLSKIYMIAGGKMSPSDMKDAMPGIMGLYKNTGQLLSSEARGRLSNLAENVMQASLNPAGNPFKEKAAQQFQQMYADMYDPAGKFVGGADVASINTAEIDKPMTRVMIDQQRLYAGQIGDTQRLTEMRNALLNTVKGHQDNLLPTTVDRLNVSAQVAQNLLDASPDALKPGELSPREAMRQKMRADFTGVVTQADSKLSSRFDELKDNNVVKNYEAAHKRVTELLGKYGDQIDSSTKTQKGSEDAVKEVQTSVRSIRRAKQEMNEYANGKLMTPAQEEEATVKAAALGAKASLLSASIEPGGEVGKAFIASHGGGQRGEQALLKEIGSGGGGGGSEGSGGNEAGRFANRMLGGYFAFQTLRAARYTFNPVIEAGQQYMAGEASAAGALNQQGAGISLNQIPGYQNVVGMANLRYGFSQNANAMMNGLYGAAGGASMGLGGGPLGAAAAIGLPAVGAGGLTLSALGMSGSAGLAAAALPVAGAVAGGVATAGLAAYVSGASTDRMAGIRYGTLSEMGQANPLNDLSGALAYTAGTVRGDKDSASAAKDFNKAAARVATTFLGGNAFFQMAENYAADDYSEHIYGYDAQDPTQKATKELTNAGLFDLRKVSPLARQAAVSQVIPQTLVNDYGISIEQGQAISNMVYSQKLGGPGTETVTRYLGQLASQGIDPNQYMQTEQSIAKLSGNLSVSAGVDSIYGNLTSQKNMTSQARTQYETNLNALGGYETAFSRSQSFGTDYSRELTTEQGMAASNLSGEAALRYRAQAGNFNALGGWNMAYEMESQGLSSAEAFGSTAIANAATYNDRDIAKQTQIQRAQITYAGLNRRRTAFGASALQYSTNAEQQEADQQATQTGESLTRSFLGSGIYSAQQSAALANTFAPTQGKQYSNLQTQLQTGATALANMSPINLAVGQQIMPSLMNQYSMSTQLGQTVINGVTSGNPMWTTAAQMSGMMQSGGGGAFQMPLMDASTGSGLFQRSMWGLNSSMMPSSNEVSNFFARSNTLYSGGLASGMGLGSTNLTSGSPWASLSSGTQQSIVSAAMGNTFPGVGGMGGVEAYADQRQWEINTRLQNASIARGLQESNLQHNYNLNTVYPMQDAQMAMDHAAKFGGSVQTDWMASNNIPAYNAGAGQFAWQRQSLGLDLAGLQAQSSQQQTQYGWQLQDLNTNNQQRLAQADWQRQDFDTQAGRNNANYSYQMQQFGARAQEIQLQKKYYEQDFSFNRQVSQLQYGWQMEDADQNIRRSSGYQRKQLVKQKERDTEMYSLQTDQEDRLKKRQEEAYKRQDDQFKKEVNHYKESAQWTDEDLKKSRARFEQEQKWADQDFNTKRSRLMQEQGWAQDTADRSLRAYEIRVEQLDAEESAAKTQEAMQEVQRTADRELEAQKFALSQQTIAMTHQEQEEMRALQLIITGARDEEAKRVEVINKVQLYGAVAMIRLWQGVTGNGLGVNVDDILNNLSAYLGGAGYKPAGLKASGGQLRSGDIVGEIGPEIVMGDSHGGATIIPTRALTPRPAGFSSETIIVEANTPIQLNGQTMANALIRFMIDPAQLQQRRRIRR